MLICVDIDYNTKAEHDLTLEIIKNWLLYFETMCCVTIKL